MAYGKSGDKLSKRDEKEILEKLDDYFQQALDDPSWREARDEMIQCFDYKENRQWTKQELSALAERGQPPTVDNQIAVTIDRIVGQFVQMRTKIEFKPRNTPDVNAANGWSDVFSYIRQCSGGEFEERDVVEDGATGGFGVFDVDIDEDGEVRYKAEDCFTILPDPKSRRYDWNEDARYICRYKWVDVDTVKDLYPSKKGKIAGLFSDSGNTTLSSVDTLRGETYVDYERNRIRLVEVQYKKSASYSRYVFSDGKVMEEDEVDDTLLGMADEAGVTYEMKEGREEQICKGVFCSGILFEHGVSKRKRFSFVPFFVNRKKSGAPYSKITTSIPLQDSINKRKSKALSLLTMNQTVAEKGAVADKQDWQAQNAKSDGFLEVEDGYFEKVRIDKNVELAQTQNQMYLEDKQSFRQVTGINPDAMGEKSEVRSGVGIQRKVAMTGLVVAPLFDNFKRTQEALAKTLHDAVTVAYNSEKVFSITDDAKVTREVRLGVESIDAIKQLKYDMIISEGTDFDTVQEQQQEMAMKTIPMVLQYGPVWGEIILEMSDLRNKEELIQRVKQLSAENAPKQPHTMTFSAQFDKLTPIERAWHYQGMGMPPEMIQQMLQQAPPPTQVLDAQAKQAADQAKMQTEGLKIQGEQAKVQADTQGQQMKLQTIAAKSQADQVKADIDIRKAQMDLVKTAAEMNRQDSSTDNG